mgnify:CR=1 FL=1
MHFSGIKKRKRRTKKQKKDDAEKYCGCWYCCPDNMKYIEKTRARKKFRHNFKDDDVGVA